MAAKKRFDSFLQSFPSYTHTHTHAAAAAASPEVMMIIIKQPVSNTSCAQSRLFLLLLLLPCMCVCVCMDTRPFLSSLLPKSPQAHFQIFLLSRAPWVTTVNSLGLGGLPPPTKRKGRGGEEERIPAAPSLSVKTRESSRANSNYVQTKTQGGWSAVKGQI